MFNLLFNVWQAVYGLFNVGLWLDLAQVVEIYSFIYSSFEYIFFKKTSCLMFVFKVSASIRAKNS